MLELVAGDKTISQRQKQEYRDRQIKASLG